MLMRFDRWRYPIAAVGAILTCNYVADERLGPHAAAAHHGRWTAPLAISAHCNAGLLTGAGHLQAAGAMEDQEVRRLARKLTGEGRLARLQCIIWGADQ
ncbi:unnamed protein product [Phytophthora lilii]|uniref:Unnamed protein product n=1 Tax=Phytophthora lilii TaxID=2077276 RepID=A0A9W6TF95_9STRA|nr:unnamed protein product [Phytophthora lilii]